MFLARTIVGLLLVILGLGYIFDPRTIIRLNAFMRERFFRDSYVLLSNRRIGAVLVAVGFLLLLMTLPSLR